MFATADGELGGYVRLGMLPGQGVSWVWAAVVGEGRRLVTVVEHEAPIPRRGSLDLRCEGLWLDLVCETPLEHWSVGLEAFGVALDDPADACTGLRGDRIGVGFDLGWETLGEPVARTGDPGGYDIACDVHGEVLLGAEVIAFDGWGSRHHTWGVRDWWAGHWMVGAGRLDDGTRWHVHGHDPTAGAGIGVAAAGHVLAGTEAAASAGAAQVSLDDASGRHGPATNVDVTLDGLVLHNEVLHPSPVPLVAPGGRAGSVVQALCRTTAGDGRTGSAWLAWTQPAP